MNYIPNFISFGTDTEKIYHYLTQNLMLNSSITNSIDGIIKSTEPREHLPLLLNLCIEYCRPYICHYELIRLNLVPPPENGATIFKSLISYSSNLNSTPEYETAIHIDLNCPFFQSIKEHIAISFYYSWLLQSNCPISLYKAIQMSEDHDYPPIDKIYLTIRSRQAKCLASQLKEKYFQLFLFIGDNVNENGKFRPTITDHALILAFIGKRLSNPYANKYRTEEYKYKMLVDLISSFSNIEFNTSKNKKNTIPTGTRIVFNNYVTERMLHFDLISFIIEKHNSFPNPDPEVIDIIFKTLGELAALPNVFSRISIAKELLNIFMSILENFPNPKEQLKAWQLHVSTLIRFLCQCSFPVLNLAFQFIMEYYVLCLTSNNPDKDKPNLLTIPNLFNPYLDLLSRQQDFTLYKRVANRPYDETSHSKKYKPFIIKSAHSYNPKLLSYNTEEYFSQIARRIFFEIMNPSTFETQTINPALFFNEKKICQLQFETAQYLTQRLPTDPLKGLVFA